MRRRFAARRSAALGVALMMTLVAASCGKKERQASVDDGGPPRDLLLITLDTFRADRAGCYGNPDGLTPAIDRALRSARIARDAFAPAPLTAVSHATMFTALEPYHHGVRENGMFMLPDSLTTLAEHLHAHGFRTAAFIAAFPLVKRFGFSQGFTTYDQDLEAGKSGNFFAERPARNVVDSVLAWLAKLPSGQRMFVWAHFFDAHQPRRVPAALRRLHVDSDYEREIRELDREIGRMFRGIEAAGRRPLVIIVSDHGEGLGDHREQTHGVLLHEGTVHGLLGFAAPWGSSLQKRWTGIHETVVRYTDIAPTTLEALGVEPMSDLDGESLFDATTSDGAYGETYYSMLQYGWSPLLCWRDERWAYLEGPNPELYDRVVDPGEKQNLIREHPDVAETMRRRIADVARAPEASSGEHLDADAREKLAALGYLGTHHEGYDAQKDPKDYLDQLNSLFQGISLFSSGQAQAALIPLQDAYRKDPRNPVAAFYLASCWRELGDTTTAMSYYRLAIDLNPHNAEAWAHLAVLRFDNDKRAEALQLLEDGLKTNPDSFSLLMTAGELTRDVGRIDEARQHLRRASEVDSTRFEPLEELAKLEERVGNRAEAAKLRERAKSLQTEDKRGS